jgi:hypothetical protein
MRSLCAAWVLDRMRFSVTASSSTWSDLASSASNRNKTLARPARAGTVLQPFAALAAFLMSVHGKV